MKAAFFICVLVAAAVAAPILVAADMADLKGTWSGNWMPKGGIPDSMTVEIRLDAGKLGGKFITPMTVEFSNITFDPKTALVSFEAADSKSGKHYKVSGKLQGTEINGTVDSNGTVGDVRLIKWTYFGR